MLGLNSDIGTHLYNFWEKMVLPKDEDGHI